MLRRLAIACVVLCNLPRALLAQAPMPAIAPATSDPPSENVTASASSTHVHDAAAAVEVFGSKGGWSNTPPTVPSPRVIAGNSDAATAQDGLASPRTIAWLKQLICENIPESYVDDKKWNQQKEVWDGLDISRDGLKIETKRKRKLVNHGTWTRYCLRAVDPQRYLDVQFRRLEATPEGKVAFDVSIELLLDVFGRMSQWVRDVQLISLSANADAVCKLSVAGTIEFQLNPLRLPPDIRIKPHVDTARIDVTYFRVRRISQLGGPLAVELGNGLRRALEDKLEESNAKLPDKMNRQLEKHSDRMLFSTHDWLESKLPLPLSR